MVRVQPRGVFSRPSDPSGDDLNGPRPLVVKIEKSFEGETDAGVPPERDLSDARGSFRGPRIRDRLLEREGSVRVVYALFGQPFTPGTDAPVPSLSTRFPSRDPNAFAPPVYPLTFKVCEFSGAESEASEDEDTELGLKADYGVVYLCRPVNEVLERDGFEGVFFAMRHRPGGVIIHDVRLYHCGSARERSSTPSRFSDGTPTLIFDSVR